VDLDEFDGFVITTEPVIGGHRGTWVVVLKCENCEKLVASYPSVTVKHLLEDAHRHMGELE